MLPVWRGIASGSVLAEQQSRCDFAMRQRHQHRRYPSDQFQWDALRFPSVWGLSTRGDRFGFHRSNAPTVWRTEVANASVNKAVAMKMGKSRVALCLEPNRLIVNGMRRSLGNGMSLSLSDVKITRKGNVLLFKRPNGAIVTATLHDSWINVSMVLGGDTATAKVRGLLGNANGNTGADDLAARDGAVLPQPISFLNLYRQYGDSWKVCAARIAADPALRGLQYRSQHSRKAVLRKRSQSKGLQPSASGLRRGRCEGAGTPRCLHPRYGRVRRQSGD